MISVLREYRYYILAFIVCEALSVVGILSFYSHRKSTYESSKIEALTQQYRAAFSAYNILANSVYEDLLDKPETLELIQGAYNSDESGRGDARGKLFALLQQAHQRLGDRNFGHVQFHFPDGTSFLRFYKPMAFGDNPLDVRYSVNLANSQKIKVQGFEEGRTFNGLRFVFPMFYEGEHLGSVELCVSSNALRFVMSQLFHENYFLIMKKDILEATLFKELMSEYSPSELSPDYLHDKFGLDPIPSGQFVSISPSVRLAIDKAIVSVAKERLGTGYPFCVGTVIGNDAYVVTFVPISNVQGKRVAYLFSYSRDRGFLTLRYDLTLLLILGSLLIAITIAFVLIRDKGRKELESEKYRTQAKKEELESIADNMGEALCVVDRNFRLVLTNPAFERLVDESQDRIIGKNTSEFLRFLDVNNREVDHSDYPNVQAIRSEGIVQGEYGAIVTRSGRLVSVGYTSAPIIGPSGISGAVTLLQDITERVRAQQELLMERKQAQLYLDATGVMLVALNPDGVIRMINKKGCEILGYAYHDIAGKNWFDFCLPESIRHEVESVYRKLLSGEDPSGGYYENHIMTGSGEQRLMAFHNVVIRDSSMAVGGVVSSGEDITERTREREALRISEERYRAIFNNASVGIEVIDSNGKFLEVNDTLARMLGYSREELENLTIIDVSHPDDIVASSFYHFKITLGENDSSRFRKRYVTKNGAVVWADVYVSGLFDSNGAYLATIGVISDITQRVSAEEERHRLVSAIEQAAEAVVITDFDGYIQYVNPAFEKITGYSPAEANGANPRILKSGEHDKNFYKQMWDTIKLGNVWTGRFVNKRKDGQLYHEEATISPVRDSSGKIVNFVAVKKDITEHLDLSRQLIQTQKMEAVGRLAGGVAHDFNNILQVIMGYSELLLGDERLPGYQKEDLEKVHNTAIRGAELVKRLLLFSRKTEIRSKPLDLNHHVIEIRKMLERTIPKTITIHLSLAEDLREVNADPIQMDQILINLALNARDAMPDGGRITIETSNIVLDEDYTRTHLDIQPGEYVLLLLSDTGTGMDTETQTHIFEPFFTTKVAGKGTGLGLATVFGIVKQHAGFIRCYSEIGLGSTFRIYFPVLISRESEEENDTERMAVGGSETILFVDDDEQIIDLGSRMLQRVGYKVLAAKNGLEALSIYERQREKISLVILDLIMPQMDGMSCLKELLKIDSAVKVIIASGYSSSGQLNKNALVGARGLLSKPFDLRHMLQIIRDIIDKG